MTCWYIFSGVAVGDKCQTVLSIVIMCLSIIALAITSTSLVLLIIYRNNIHDTDDSDPVMQERLKLKARQRWRKALRQIIYARRKGEPLYDLGTFNHLFYHNLSCNVKLPNCFLLQSQYFT
jgi:hypothetical protein